MTRDEIRGLQRLLAAAGTYTGLIDGVWGPDSQKAAEAAILPRSAALTTDPPRLVLTPPAAVDLDHFFASVRAGILGPKLSQDEVSGCLAVIEAFKGCPTSWLAYALATAFHETARTMQPIKEMGGEKYFFRMYDIGGERPQVAARLGNSFPGDGVGFPGRGYVQVTGRANYKRADDELHLNGSLVANPDRALEPAIAAQIMFLGMTEGWFTGRKLVDYLPTELGTAGQFVGCRKIINGVDRAEMIAGYAMQFQEALTPAAQGIAA